MTGATASGRSGTADARPSGEPPVIGRSTELDRLVAFLRAARPGIALVTGAPGLGRTRLLREVAALAHAEGWNPVRVTGSRSGRDVPLGALAHVVAPVEGSERPDSFTLLQRGLQALRERRGTAAGDPPGPPLPVLVDDAHLVDELSTTVLHQLVSGGEAMVVATARYETPLLTRADDVDSVELSPLTEPDADRLLTALLHDDAEARTAERLWQATRGNPSFLREMVRTGSETGRLTSSNGLWRWEGEMTPSRRLVERVLADLDVAGAAGLEALEAVAAAGRVDPARFAEIAAPDVADVLERRELLDVDADGRVGVAHPMHARVLTRRVSASVRVPAAGAPSPVVALPGPGRAAPGDEAERAAQANRELDHARAETLARRCLSGDADPSADPDGVAHLELVEALRWQDRRAETDAACRAAEDVVTSDDARARIALTRALAQRRTAASADRVRPEPDVGPLPAAAEAALAHLGELPARALVLARSVDAATAGRWDALRLAALAGGLAGAGRVDDALRNVQASRDAVRDATAPAFEIALTGLLQVDAELTALRTAGRFDELDGAVHAAHRRNMAHPGWAGDAFVALHRGRAARLRGDLTGALRWLTEAVAGTRRQDPLTLADRCTAELALVRALLGDTTAASALLDELPPDAETPGPVTAQARLWCLALSGRSGEAVRRGRLAARAAAGRGDHGAEAELLHAAGRVDRPGEVSARLRELAGTVEGELIGLRADHVEAAATGSGTELDRVAAGFETAGAWLSAADAAAAAAVAHRAAGDRRRSSASAATAARLAEVCGRATTPALSRMNPPRLTARERQVARLAAGGTSNAGIAAELVVSVRTVETHLAHVYAKLGLGTRDDLAGALPGEVGGAGGADGTGDAAAS